MQIYIHGKAYKPGVNYLEGSYSLLIGHYLKEMGLPPIYIDPLTEETTPASIRGIVLLAHNQQVTYGYAGVTTEQELYCAIEPPSTIIDPWRKYKTANSYIKVIHYGNTRL
jgi:hypothetical protein